jgi:hypothetical protein
MDIVTKVLGVAIGFYVIRGALGRSKERRLNQIPHLAGDLPAGVVQSPIV